MSYLVLARKYRPRNFSELVGQQHVLQALVNALTNEKLHHAYIFSGTRGVGKTTIARIFAKCLNNPDGISADPDMQSDVAKAIDSGRFIDLIEVDAASRTKVEQTRELLENVSYPPTQGRFKIYLIDEAHMLSTSSFNALLKTLEEPPAFVKFLFATTDPQKLPVTIISRCLLFHLRRISQKAIADRLGEILQKEGVHYEKNALTLLAKAGDGSLRDALSITDQAIAFTNAKIQSQDMAKFLGMLDNSRIESLLDALLDAQPKEMIRQVRYIDGFAPHYPNLIEQLLELIQKAAVITFETEQATSPIVERLAKNCTPEVLQLYFQLLVRGKAEIMQLANQSMGFEMLMLRLHAFTPVTSEQHMQVALGYSNHTVQSSADSSAITSSASSATTDVVADTGTKAHATTTDSTHTIQTQKPVQVHDLPKNGDDWENIFIQLDCSGFARQLAGYCAFFSCNDEGMMQVHIGKRHRELLTQEYHREIVKAIQQYLQRKIILRYQVVDQDPEDSPLARKRRRENGDEAMRKHVEEDPQVQQLLDQFDGKVINVTASQDDTKANMQSQLQHTTEDTLKGEDSPKDDT